MTSDELSAALGFHRFIALEGPDGSGKTSIRKHIFARLQRASVGLLTIPQHGWLVPAASAVIVGAKYEGRQMPSSELLEAYLQDKLATADHLIRPHLPFRHVLADRYVVSDAVYNEVLWGVPHTETLERYMRARVLLPDLVVYLDTPTQIAFDRANLRRRRGTDTIHVWDTLPHQERLYDLFQQILGRWPSPVVRIDNSGSIDATLRSVDSEVIEQWLVRA